MTPPVIEIKFNLRPYQARAHEARTRFTVRVFHRRAGKTFLAIAEQVADCLSPKRPLHRAYYLAPTYGQAKAIAWVYVEQFAEMISKAPGMGRISLNQSELRCDFPNGSRLQLLGASSYDALRGRYADDVCLDETAQIPRSAWSKVLLPMLSDRQGRATFLGTPAGRMNLLRDVWDKAEGGGDWSRVLLRVDQTGALPQSEIDTLRASMSEEEFNQEYLCSWNSALIGAYYGREVSAGEIAGRWTSVKHERALPVTAALDLGYSDAMVATFWQQVGTEHRCIRAQAWQTASIPQMLDDWARLPYRVDHVILPHDARVHELGTGITREEIFRGRGYDVALCPRQGIHEGIEAVRNLLPNCYFDETDTDTLREALLAYRFETNEKRGVGSKVPVHDWSSNWADSVRYYAVGRLGRQATARQGQGLSRRGGAQQNGLGIVI